MSKDVKVLIDKYEYDKLVEIEKEYNSKNFYCEIGFVLGRNYTPFFVDRFYYGKDDKIPQKIGDYAIMLENIFEAVKDIVIPEEKEKEVNNTIYMKLMNWFNNRK